jgi:hypothetical protein
LRKKDHIVLVLVAQKSEDIDSQIESNDLDDMGYVSKGTRYRLRISNDDLTNKKDAIKELLTLARRNTQMKVSERTQVTRCNISVAEYVFNSPFFVVFRVSKKNKLRMLWLVSPAQRNVPINKNI